MKCKLLFVNFYFCSFSFSRLKEAMMCFITVELDTLPVDHFDRNNYGIVLDLLLQGNPMIISFVVVEKPILATLKH